MSVAQSGRGERYCKREGVGERRELWVSIEWREEIDEGGGVGTVAVLATLILGRSLWSAMVEG